MSDYETEPKEKNGLVIGHLYKRKKYPKSVYQLKGWKTGSVATGEPWIVDIMGLDKDDGWISAEALVPANKEINTQKIKDWLNGI